MQLCIDICQRNGKKKLLWLGDKDKALNYTPAADEMVLTVHRWFANKAFVPVNTEVLTRILLGKAARYQYRKSKDLFRIDYYTRLLRDGNVVYIPMAGYANNDSLPITNSMLTFLVAVQTDGSYMYAVRKDGTRSYYGVEFHLSKERKIERLRDCLEECHLAYNVTNPSNGTTKIRIYNKEGINIVTYICEKWLRGKCFTWEWLNLSESQAHHGCDAGTKR